MLTACVSTRVTIFGQLDQTLELIVVADKRFNDGLLSCLITLSANPEEKKLLFLITFSRDFEKAINVFIFVY